MSGCLHYLQSSERSWRKSDKLPQVTSSNLVTTSLTQWNLCVVSDWCRGQCRQQVLTKERKTWNKPLVPLRFWYFKRILLWVWSSRSRANNLKSVILYAHRNYFRRTIYVHLIYYTLRIYWPTLCCSVFALSNFSLFLAFSLLSAWHVSNQGLLWVQHLPTQQKCNAKYLVPL